MCILICLFVMYIQVIFDTLIPYFNHGQCPILTVELRWIAASDNCVLCPESYATNITNVLTVELIGMTNEPNYIQFVNEVS